MIQTESLKTRRKEFHDQMTQRHESQIKSNIKLIREELVKLSINGLYDEISKEDLLSRLEAENKKLKTIQSHNKLNSFSWLD